MLENRTFEVGDILFVLDNWRPYVVLMQAEITSVNKKQERFTLKWNNKLYEINFSEYGRLIFGNQEEAMEVIKRLPKRYAILYYVTETGNVIKDVCHGIYSVYDTETGKYDLVIRLDQEKEVSIDQIGKTLFYSEKAAKYCKVPP